MNSISRFRVAARYSPSSRYQLIARPIRQRQSFPKTTPSSWSSKIKRKLRHRIANRDTIAMRCTYRNYPAGGHSLIALWNRDLIVTFPISSFAKRTKDDIAKKNVNASALLPLQFTVSSCRILSPLTARRKDTEERRSYIRALALALALARVFSFVAARIQQWKGITRLTGKSTIADIPADR